MAVGSDGRYYAEAEVKGKGAPEVREKLERKLAGDDKKVEAPKPEPNTSVDAATHPAAEAEKKPAAVKDFQKK